MRRARHGCIGWGEARRVSCCCSCCCCCCLTPYQQSSACSFPPWLGVRFQGAAPARGDPERVVEEVGDSENKGGRKQSVQPGQVLTRGHGRRAP